MFKHLVSVRLRRFMKRSGVISTTQFAYWKGLGTCDALLCMSHILLSALKSGQEARIVHIGFSAEGLSHKPIEAATEGISQEPI